jgi:dihydroxy-acid dehydratase
MPSDPNPSQPTMASAPTPSESQAGLSEPRYLDFVRSNETHNSLGEPMLNRYSTMITREHDFPGAQAMLYAAGVPDKSTMKNAPCVLPFLSLHPNN